MILDIKLRVASAQAFTDADEVSDSSVDLGNPTVKRRVGAGRKLSALFVVSTAAAGDSASATDTTDLEVISSAAATLTSPTVLASRRVAAALMVAGAIFEVPIPANTPSQRYLGARVTQGTGDTASFSVYIVPSDHVQDYLAYTKGYTI